jgi:lipoprotein signal peptidase
VYTKTADLVRTRIRCIGQTLTWIELSLIIVTERPIKNTVSRFGVLESMVGATVVQPPIDAVAPAGWATATLAAVCIIDVGLLMWAAYDWRRRRSPILFVCLIGGAVSNIVEAPLDTLLMCYFPSRGQAIAYTTFDRPIPLWATLCYPILFGVMAYVFFRVFETRRTRAQFWKIVLIGFAINVVLEFSILSTHIYMYYGEQPFRVLNFPLYWLVLNNGASVLVATIAYHLRGYWGGPRWLALILVFPSAQLGFLAFVGWPLASVMNTSAGLLWTTLAGIVTVATGLFLFDVAAQLGCVDGRWRLDQRDTSATQPAASATSRS